VTYHRRGMTAFPLAISPFRRPGFFFFFFFFHLSIEISTSSRNKPLFLLPGYLSRNPLSSFFFPLRFCFLLLRSSPYRPQSDNHFCFPPQPQVRYFPPLPPSPVYAKNILSFFTPFFLLQMRCVYLPFGLIPLLGLFPSPPCVDTSERVGRPFLLSIRFWWDLLSLPAPEFAFFARSVFAVDLVQLPFLESTQIVPPCRRRSMCIHVHPAFSHPLPNRRIRPHPPLFSLNRVFP